MCPILWSEYKTTKLQSLPLTVPPALGQEELALMAGLWKSGPKRRLEMQVQGVHCPHVDILDPHKHSFTFRQKTKNSMT